MEKEFADSGVREIFDFFYPDEDELRRTLLKHSSQVGRKALELAERTSLELDPACIAGGALLHDIGIRRCDAPDIFCRGELPYLCHGIAGAEMLRRYGADHGLDLERFARICERHTGSGLSAEEIAARKLPLPLRDYLPETPEEKLICLADKFFSKSGSMEEKSFEAVRRSMARFGAAPLRRFDELWSFFKFSPAADAEAHFGEKRSGSA